MFPKQFCINDKLKSLSRKKKQVQKNSLERTDPSRKEGAQKITFFGGSMTLEASLALTLLLLFVTSLCQLFLVMELQLHMQRALEQVGNEAAGYSYVSNQIPIWESESRLLGQIREYLLTELSEEALRLRFVSVLGEEYLERSPVEGGAGGISFAGSVLRSEDQRIRLVLSYRVRLPISVLGFSSVQLCQQSYRYAWLGDAKPETAAGQDEQEETMVYITENSQVYHLTQSCTYLKLSVRAVASQEVAALRNDNGARYYACELCHPSGQEATLYITNDGTRYHSSRDCGGISRNVTAIPLSQAGDRRPCSRCGQSK